MAAVPAAADAARPPEPRVEFLEHGAVLVRGLLTREEQCLVLATSFRARSPEAVAPNESGLYSPLFTFNWPGRKMAATDVCEGDPRHFDAVLELGRRAVRLARAEAARRGVRPHDNERLRLPDGFEPSALRGILYPENGYLHAHQDMLMGWVGSLSLGRGAEFFYGPSWEIDHKETRQVELHSGDFILLNGQVLHHGVLRLAGDSPPPFWTRMVSRGAMPAHWHRVNVQFRDPRHIF